MKPISKILECKLSQAQELLITEIYMPIPKEDTELAISEIVDQVIKLLLGSYDSDVESFLLVKLVETLGTIITLRQLNSGKQPFSPEELETVIISLKTILKYGNPIKK